jgi:hypothetical protein
MDLWLVNDIRRRISEEWRTETARFGELSVPLKVLTIIGYVAAFCIAFVASYLFVAATMAV